MADEQQPIPFHRTAGLPRVTDYLFDHSEDLQYFLFDRQDPSREDTTTPPNFISIAKEVAGLKEYTTGFLRFADVDLFPGENKEQVLQILAMAFIFVHHMKNRPKPWEEDTFYPIDMKDRIAGWGTLATYEEEPEEIRKWRGIYLGTVWQKAVVISLAYQKGYLDEVDMDQLPDDVNLFRLKDDFTEGKEQLIRHFSGKPFNLHQAIDSLNPAYSPRLSHPVLLPSVADLINPDAWNYNPEERDTYLDE